MSAVDAARSMDRVLITATAAFVESDATELPSVGQTGTGDRLRELVGHLPVDQRRLLRLGVSVLQVISMLRHGRRFDRLSIERARSLLRWLERAPWKALRRLHRSLKMLCQYAYFAGEETWSGCGYGGPWIGRIEVAADPPPDIGDLA